MNSIKNLMIDAIQQLNPEHTVDNGAPLGKIAQQLHDDILSIPHLSFEVVQALPTTGIKTDVIYLVPGSATATGNVYEEWIYTNNAWENIGTTELDLSGKMDLCTTGVPQNSGHTAPDYTTSDFTGLSVGQMFYCQLGEQGAASTTYWIKTGSAYAVRLALYSDVTTALGDIETALAALL